MDLKQVNCQPHQTIHRTHFILFLKHPGRTALKIGIMQKELKLF